MSDTEWPAFPGRSAPGSRSSCSPAGPLLSWTETGRKTFKQGGLLGDSSVWQLCLTALYLILRPAVMHSADGCVNLQMYLQNARTSQSL